MLGAIIGDLAAWTWENEHEAFYPQLYTDKAQLSEYSDVYLLTVKSLLDNPVMGTVEYSRLFREVDYPTRRINAVLRAVAVGWIFQGEETLERAANAYCLRDEKEDWYASQFMAKLIWALRCGATKDEAAQVEHIGTFSSFATSKDWQSDDGTLSILVRAWNAFYSAFDFTSALHAAMKLPGDRIVNAMLVGALAEAMYGSEQILLKQKYAKETVLHLEMPSHIERKYGALLQLIRTYKERNRVFYPKNRARTNVELHCWTDIGNPYENWVIDKELRRGLLKAYDTGWEARYGLYLLKFRI